MNGGYPMVVSAAFAWSLTAFSPPNTSMNSGAAPRRSRSRGPAASLFAIALLGATALSPSAAGAAERDAVRVWNANAATAFANPNTAATPGLQFAPPVAAIHVALVQGAVYDGVSGSQGGPDPCLDCGA